MLTGTSNSIAFQVEGPMDAVRWRYLIAEQREAQAADGVAFVGLHYPLNLGKGHGASPRSSPGTFSAEKRGGPCGDQNKHIAPMGHAPAQRVRKGFGIVRFGGNHIIVHRSPPH